MTGFYQWIGSLSMGEAISLFVLVALFMLAIPYVGKFWRYVRILFEDEELEIVAFEHRIIPDVKVYEDQEETLYYMTKTSPLVEGGKILLVWEVKGAGRIDISGIGKNLKGDTATIILHEKNRDFILTAYASFGFRKISKKLSLEPVQRIEVETAEISAMKPVYLERKEQGLLSKKAQELMKRKLLSKDRTINFSGLSRFKNKGRVQEPDMEMKEVSYKDGGISLKEIVPMDSMKNYNFSLLKYNDVLNNRSGLFSDQLNNEQPKINKDE